MNILVYFSPETLINSYVIFNDTEKRAIIVDPISFDVPLFNLIESKKLTIDSVLLTHLSPEAERAVQTIKRVYDPQIFGNAYSSYDFECNYVEHNSIFESSGLSIMSFKPIGRHMDSLMFRIEDAFFPGDVISAGNIARDEINREILSETMRELFDHLPGHTRVLPLYGPPTTVGIERETNMDLIAETALHEKNI